MLFKLLPAAEEIARAIARRDKARIIPAGEVALRKPGHYTGSPEVCISN